MSDSITLFFDGNAQVFSINDLAVSLALFLNPDATTTEIQQVAQDIFGLGLATSQVTTASSSPLTQYDFNGDGTRGDIQDLGVAIAVFLGETTAEGVNRVCQDLISQSCDVTITSSMPTMGSTGGIGIGPGSPGSGILPENTPAPLPVPSPPPGPIATVEVNPQTITFATGTGPGITQFLTLTPSAAPVGGDLVVRLTSNNFDLVGLSNESEESITVTFPQGSAAPRTVLATRRLPSGSEGNAVITVVRDDATVAGNFPINSIDTAVAVRLERTEGAAEEEPGVGNLSVTPETVVFQTGTTIGSPQVISLVPSEPPQGGDLVVQVRSNSSAVLILDTENNTVAQELTITFREGSPASRNVVLVRQIQATSSANAVISVTLDPSSGSEVNFPEGSINRIVLVNLQAAVSEPPRVEPTEPLTFTVEQITLTAETFTLTQASRSGLLGYAPSSGPLGLLSSFGTEVSQPGFQVPAGSPGDLDNDGILDGCLGVSVSVPGSNFFIVDQAFGVGTFRLFGENAGATFENPGTLDPRNLRRVPITLAGQRLSFFRNSTNSRLFASIAPSNFDQDYSINYFERIVVDSTSATCPADPLTGIRSVVLQEGEIEFDELRSTRRLLTLRGTAEGVNEPDSNSNGLLFGPQIGSDRPTAPLGSNSLLNLVDPRFSGVQNQFTVAGLPIPNTISQVRTDIAFVFDQVRDQPTEAARRDQPPFVRALTPEVNEDGNFPNDFDPATQLAPNIDPATLTAEFASLIGRGSSSCPASQSPDIVCGRFQFNQTFAESAVDDLLLIQGTFFGRAVDFVTLVAPDGFPLPTLVLPPGVPSSVIMVQPSVAPTNGDVVVNVSTDSDLITLSETVLTFPQGSTAPQMVVVERAGAGLGNGSIQFRLNNANTASNARTESVDTAVTVTLQ